MMTSELFCRGSGSYNCTDGHSWGPGVRDIYILHYILSGRGYLICEGKKFEVRKGQIFVIFPNTLVQYYPDMSEPFSYKWVDLGGKMVRQLINSTSLSKTSPVSVEFDNKMEDIFNQAVNGEPLSESNCNPYILNIFSYIIEKMPGHQIDSERNTAEIAFDYINNSLHRPTLNVTEVAVYCCVCRAHLYRLLKKTYNISPLKLIEQLRLAKAEKLIKTTSLPIKSIAYSVGYYDSLYFSNVFKKKYNLSPSKYREKTKN